MPCTATVSRWKKSVASSPCAWVHKKAANWCQLRAALEARGPWPGSAGSCPPRLGAQRPAALLDAAVPPAWIIPGQPQYQLTDLVANRWAPWQVRARPVPPNQAAVPRQQRGGGDDAVPAQPP